MKVRVIPGQAASWSHGVRIMREPKLFDLAAEKRGETEKALRLFDGAKTEWVPKQLVEDNGDGTYTMPEWLALDKGFI